MFQALPSKNLGLCFDTSHDFLYADPPLQLLKDWGHRLVTTHFSDTDGRRDYHWLPGEGSIDFNSVGEHFPESYTGCHMLEVVPKVKGGPLDEFLVRARESARLLPLDLAIERRSGQAG